MPDEKFLADSERILKNLEREILERIAQNKAMTDSPRMNSAVGRLTYIDAYQQEQMGLHARRQLQSRLAAVRAALDLVKAGTYGTCINCGVVILPERLEHIPETPYCTKCGAGR